MSNFLILGAAHSGTSTLTGLVNQAPAVLCLFEVDFTEGREGKYRSRYQKYFNSWDYLFGSSRNPAWSLEELKRITGKRYASVGTKNQGLRFDLLGSGVDQIFCTARAPQSWISHPSTFLSYGLSRGFFHASIDYTLFIDAAIRRGAIMFSLEKLYRDPDSWRKILLANLPGFSLPEGDWWNTMADIDEIKAAAHWLPAHPTSARQPADFRQQLAFLPNPALLKVFSAYSSMNVDTAPRELKPGTRSALQALRNEPPPFISELIDTDQPLFQELANPKPEAVGLRDRAYLGLNRIMRRAFKN